MGYTMRTVLWAILALKNLLILVLLMLVFGANTGELGGTARVLYTLGAGSVTLGFSYAELLLVDWLIKAALGKH